METGYRKIFFIVLFCLCLGSDCLAQNDASLLNKSISEDSAAISALALYPASVRKNIIEACAYPEVVVRIQNLQKQTKEEFKGLLAPYNKEEQQKIWDITRYPGLIDSLADGGKKSKDEINRVLKNYPLEVHETALQYGASHYDLFLKIKGLNIKSNDAFVALIKNYPPAAQSAFREIINYPEVINILNENMRMTVLVGDIYKRNPDLVNKKLDSLNLKIAKQNAIDLEEWKKGLEENPQAKKEFEESAKEYAKEQGYNDNDLVINDTKIIVNYVCYSYPYWYGYPWWYDYPFWYPYPYWYDWGFYYGPYGIVYTGFPSWYFTNWYFYHSPHHYYYPYFSDYCIGYYYGHRNSYTGFNKSVNNWVEHNESNLPKNFLTQNEGRPKRMKEFGKFEIDYQQSQNNNQGAAVTKNDFLQNNSANYPSMAPVLVELPKKMETKPIQETKPKTNYPIQQPKQKPPVIIPKQKTVKPPPQQKPKQNAPPKQKVIPKNNPPVKKNNEAETSSINFQLINEAQCYHGACWGGTR